MRNDLEAPLALLLTHLEDKVPGIKTAGRRLKMPVDVTAQPALFVRHIGAEDDFQEIFSRTTILAEIWLYSRAGENPDAVPGTALNALACSVRNAFTPDDRATGRFTLGGAVFWARIEGRSDYYPGDIDTYSVAVLPVKITLP